MNRQEYEAAVEAAWAEYKAAAEAALEEHHQKVAAVWAERRKAFQQRDRNLQQSRHFQESYRQSTEELGHRVCRAARECDKKIAAADEAFQQSGHQPANQPND